MCGIAGIRLTGETHRARLGELLGSMLSELRDRGPDSAGVALYGDPGLCREGWAAVSVLAAGMPASDLAVTMRRLLPGLEIDVAAVAGIRVVTAPAAPGRLAAAAAAALPDAPLLGAGTGLAVLKGIGDPLDLIRAFGLAGRGGYQAVGHTRMATESAVTVAHSHPFSVSPDLCLVHNGSFANHDTIRRQLMAEGISFATDNDSEVAAAFVGACLSQGDDLDKALRKVCHAFDGFYTLLVTTATEFAVVRDAIACKPALIAEGPGWVAMASEYRALAALPGISEARVFEPAPEEVYVWP